MGSPIRGGRSGDDTLGVDALVTAARALGTSDLSPRRFLHGLAISCAGIRFGPLGMLDLARGGRNRHPGRGFRARYDDGSRGQARHFAGVAFATSLIGGRLAHLAAVHLLRDAPGSADDLLSRSAIRFSRSLLTGRLSTAEAGDWLDHELRHPDARSG